MTINDRYCNPFSYFCVSWQNALQSTISHLSSDDAVIITLFYLYEHTLDEICQITSLTMTNAKTKLCRARQRLKVIVESKFATELI